MREMRETMTRVMTGKLIDMAENGYLSWETIAVACLNYMSETDVADMARCDFDMTDDSDDETDDNDEDHERCPSCSDYMDPDHDNLRPTWSDKHDDIVCWWCAFNDTITDRQAETGE